jgi:hypothetical protein
VVPVSQALKRITEGLELPDGVGMLQRSHEMGKPLPPFCCLKSAVANGFTGATAQGTL